MLPSTGIRRTTEPIGSASSVAMVTIRSGVERGDAADNLKRAVERGFELQKERASRRYRSRSARG